MRVVPRMIRIIRPGMQKCVPGRFARISRVGRRKIQDTYLYVRRFLTVYDKQRE